jgi:hypothetical protein
LATDNKAEKWYNSLPHTAPHLSPLSFSTKQSDDSSYFKTKKKFTLKKTKQHRNKQRKVFIDLFIFVVGYICLQALLHF